MNYLDKLKGYMNKTKNYSQMSQKLNNFVKTNNLHGGSRSQTLNVAKSLNKKLIYSLTKIAYYLPNIKYSQKGGDIIEEKKAIERITQVLEKARQLDPAIIMNYIAELKKDRDALRKDLEESLLKQEQLNKEIEEKNRLYKNLEDDKTALEIKLSEQEKQLQNELGSAQFSAKEFQTQLNLQEEDKKKLADAMKEEREALATIREERDRVKEEIGKLTSSKLTVDEQVKGLTERLAKVEEELAEAKITIDRLTNENANLTKTNDEYKTDRSELTTLINNLEQISKEADIKITTLQNNINEISSERGGNSTVLAPVAVTTTALAETKENVKIDEIKDIPEENRTKATIMTKNLILNRLDKLTSNLDNYVDNNNKKKYVENLNTVIDSTNSFLKQQIPNAGDTDQINAITKERTAISKSIDKLQTDLNKLMRKQLGGSIRHKTHKYSNYKKYKRYN